MTRSRQNSDLGDAPHRFGGPWTEKKLQAVSAYLTAYNTALKNQKFRRVYIDAFAGTGSRASGHKDASRARKSSAVLPSLFGPVPPRPEKVLKGSAQRALEVVPPFHQFIFIERNRKRFSALKRLAVAYPEKAKDIRFILNDANAAIVEICKLTDWSRTRAVLFLDPYGMQVDWTTIQAIARTRAIDLWYLVPAGIGIGRLIPRSGNVDARWAERLDRMLGERGWQRRFLRERHLRSLFGESVQIKTKHTTIDQILCSAEMEAAATDFRQLHERSLPRRDSRQVYCASVERDEKRIMAHLSDIDQTS